MSEERANLITDVKNQVLIEGMRGLFLINGGGAVALATWLQTVWDKEWAAPMLHWQLWAIATFAIGVSFGALVPLCRYLAFIDPNRLTPKKNFWWWAHVITTVLSILSFAVASGFVVKGGFAALEKQATVAPNPNAQKQHAD